MKKRCLILCISSIIIIILAVFLVTLLSTQKPVKESYVHKEHAYYFSEEEIENKNITYPGLIDYAMPQADTIFKKNGVRAFYGEITVVIPYYIKNVDGEGYQQSNLLCVSVERGYSGGYKKGKKVYIVDFGLRLEADDAGKKGIFIPDNTGCELISSSDGKTRKADGVLVPEENRFLLEDRDTFENIHSLWQVKKLWRKSGLVD
ncbi:MAG: hypothetical protein K2K70_08955 [Lachnospiraceae bacterium]|nr:hypothetical protein [Lachnospiraceae bacterium]